MYEILDKIKVPNDIKKIDSGDYEQLASEIRDFLIESVSKTGGHLASNLGAVELTMALHICLKLPDDKIVWDVGHQSYVHKLLTGRREGFKDLRHFGGMSGFPKREESACDAFNTGHSSTSLSSALGLACSRDIKGEKYCVVAVIGDGSMTGGMAYEALNNLHNLGSNLIIVLNDNKMSISENVGGLSRHLTELRTRESYLDFKKDLEQRLRQIPRVGKSMVRSMKRSKDQIRQLLTGGGIFEDFGIKYIGPVDGHDVKQLVRVFNAVKNIDEPVVVHVLTNKGQGFVPAQDDPAAFHGVGRFDPLTGEIAPSKEKSYTEVFSDKITKMAGKHSDIVAVTAAMPDGTGLTRFSKKFPKRFFDVGIAEQHAVTFAAGMAAGGLKPFVALYSSFLQRSFDQVIHDACLQRLPIVFCIDRAGIVGADGETHQGIFDLSFLSLIPGLVVCAPKNAAELCDMMDFAYEYDGPIAIRYPRGKAYDGLAEKKSPVIPGKSEKICSGSGLVLLAVGSMVETAVGVREILKAEGIEAGIVNARFVKPLDEDMLLSLADEYRLIVTLEENVIAGGFGEAVSEFMYRNCNKTPKIIHVGIDDCFVPHGSPDKLKLELGLDSSAIAGTIMELIKQDGAVK